MADLVTVRFSFYFYSFLLLFLVILLFTFFKKFFWRFLLLLLIFFIFGFWRWQIYEDKLNLREQQFQKIMKKEGEWLIKIWQTQKIKNQQKITAQLLLPEEKNPGKILVYLPSLPNYQVGEQLLLEGKLETPPVFDDFNYRDFLRYHEIFAVIRNVEILQEFPPKTFLAKITCFFYGVKDKLIQSEKTIFKEPAGSLASALLFGGTNLSRAWRDKFSATGIIHIISVSGFHMTVIVAFILALFFRLGFSRRQSFIFISIMILFYLLVLNFPSAAVRSALMAMLAFWAYISGRLAKAIYLLVFAAFVMLLLQPQLLLHDISFQLSFAATLGLVTLFPYLEEKLKYIPNPFKIRSIIFLTLSAQIFTLPISLIYFEKFSLIAPLANLATIPFAPFLMLAGFVGGILGLVYLPLAKIILYPFWFLFLAFFRVIDFLSAIPYAQIQLNLHIRGLVIYYLVLFILIISVQKFFPAKNK